MSDHSLNLHTSTVPGTLFGRIRKAFMHVALRAFLLLYLAGLKFLGLFRTRKRELPERGLDILLTGTFHSDNWITAHLMPLSLSSRVRRIRMVATSAVPAVDKVEPIYPPRWLTRTIGSVPARLVTFLWVGCRRHPDVVGGFHLLFNGLAAAWLSRLTGAYSLYICGGGASEVADGGTRSENRIFQRIETPDPVIERRLITAVDKFDLVVTMGEKTAGYFRRRGVSAQIHVIGGGRDGRIFSPGTPASNSIPQTDVIFVGRLAAIKRVDLFLRAVALASKKVPLRAAVVGEGPLESELKRIAFGLGIESNVIFAGKQSSLQEWLTRSKLFVLTSDSEGLSLSLMEAMLCGLPAVVSDVGDLADLVTDRVNGFLVSERAPEAFAARIVELLADRARLASFSASARRLAERYDLRSAAQLWDTAFTATSGNMLKTIPGEGLPSRAFAGKESR